MKKKLEKKKPAKRTKAKPLSARKLAEPVRQDDENHRILVENSQDGAFIMQRNTVALANKAFAVMTGYPSKKMIGMEFKSLLPPDSAFLGKIRKMRSKGDFDLHLLHRDRVKRLFVRMSVRRILYNGKTAVLGVVRDQTKLEKASEALEKSQTRYRELYDNLRDGFAVLSLKGQIILWNRAFQEMLGYPENELRKLSHADITPKRWHALEAKIIKEQVVPKKRSDFYEKEYIRKDGSVFPVTMRTHLMRNEQGKPAGMWVSVRDIEDRKRVVEALRQSEERYRTLFEDSRDAIAIKGRAGVDAHIDV